MPSNKKTKRSKRNRKTKGAHQSPVSGYVVKSHFGQVRCPPVPREFSVALKYRLGLNLSSTGSVQLQSFGLLEFLGNIPAYASTYYNLYKYCKVVGVESRFRIVNTSSIPLQISTGVVPANEVSNLTIDEAAEVPGAINKMISPAGGLDKVVLKKSYIPMEMYGNLVTDRYWITATQASSTTPLESVEPVIYLAIQPFVSVNWTAVGIIDFVYHVQFFDLNGPV